MWNCPIPDFHTQEYSNQIPLPLDQILEPPDKGALIKGIKIIIVHVKKDQFSPPPEKKITTTTTLYSSA